MHATLWEATAKTEVGGASFANNAQPCMVTFNTDAAGGQLLFEWPEHVAVDVVLRPGAGEALLRGRIEATIDEDKPSGLVSVAFPVVKGSSRCPRSHSGTHPESIASGRSPCRGARRGGSTNVRTTRNG